MANEKIVSKSLPILKDEQFDFTVKDVKRILRETKKELRATQEGLDNNPAEKEKRFLKSHLRSVQAQYEILSASPKNVLAKIKHFYDRTAQLGRQGMNEDSMLEQLTDEFSDIGSYYGLLREKPWGYRLGQDIMATKAGRQLKKSK